MLFRWVESPMPETWSSWGVCSAPAARTTSRETLTDSRVAFEELANYTSLISAVKRYEL